MNKTALFCDGTEGYVYPPEPKESELVTFRFRTAKDDVDRVGLVTSADTYVMEKECTQGEFDYYTFETRLGEEPFRYCFEVQSGTEKYYYGRCGISREILEYYNFVVVPGFSTPDWAKGAVMYQIFTDRFYNGDKSNDVETNEYYYIGDYSQRVTNWDKYPANMGVREFYGGDLQGVMDKLDYLQDLGVEVVYFNPLFVSPSNHKYDIQDYDYIDPHYGKIVDDGGEVLPNGVTDNSQATKYKKRTTGLKNLEASNELFIKLVEELHRRGMKVILDGVFNHCGSFNKWMDRERIYEGEEDYEPGAYVSADSPYRSYFRFFKEGPENWPYNGNYDGWWGHLGDIAYAINSHAQENGYSVVEEIGGHGIGLEFHEEPFVSYVTPKGSEMVLVPGMMFTIEPMINQGSPEFYVDEDNGWTVYTDDDGLSAQIEYMVLIKEDGVEVLTK